MPNMTAILSSHNKKILSLNDAVTSPREQSAQPSKTCNCRKRPECPLEGNCLQQNVIYQAAITGTTTESYIGLATNFKEWYRNHLTSFWHANRRNETEQVLCNQSQNALIQPSMNFEFPPENQNLLSEFLVWWFLSAWNSKLQLLYCLCLLLEGC